MEHTREYRAIARHYGTRTTRRSGVPLMRHIDEGLAILVAIAAGEAAMRAFCLHPIVQTEADVRITELTDDVHVATLALEYCKIANQTLSTRPIASAAEIPLSTMPEVNTMLIADKVQNRADFLRHHAAHPRHAELDRYFRLWLERLGLDEVRYAELAEYGRRTALELANPTGWAPTRAT